MDLFVSDRLNPRVFALDVRQGTHDLGDILAAAAETGSSLVESTHFLYAMSGIKNGLTVRYLAGFGLTAEQWRAGLAECVEREEGALPPLYLSREALHPSAKALLQTAVAECKSRGRSEIDEAVLLLAAIANLTEPATHLLTSVGIDLDQWRGDIEVLLLPAEPIAVFADESGLLLAEAFSRAVGPILQVMRDEAEALGYERLDPRHLLMALLAQEGGITQYGLFQQGHSPKKIREALALNLKAKARRQRSRLVLSHPAMLPVLQKILVAAGEMAGQDRCRVVAEKHLLLAFLGRENTARAILEDERVDLARLAEVVKRHDPADDPEPPDAVALADIDTVRKRLQARLVGQDEAIERILPAVQRMQFGFSVPERPAGVFLFCGQSGSGKTEMAKELARAVYGSEDNLIFLEMGQFNSAESMNIFVGAPPGYIGYGEGKLTNGLRDKPRSVVLFDEVEKAQEKRVLDALLRFLDEGKIDDPAGPVRDGSQCLVILTSNAGAEELAGIDEQYRGCPEAQTVMRKAVREAFKKENFRVEFLNRVDELILFQTLSKDNYTEIAKRLLTRTLTRLQQEKQVEVAVDETVAKTIGTYCKDIEEGARAVSRLVQAVVVSPVIDFLVRNRLTPPQRLRVDLVPRNTVVFHSEDQEEQLIPEPQGRVSVVE